MLARRGSAAEFTPHEVDITVLTLPRLVSDRKVVDNRSTISFSL